LQESQKFDALCRLLDIHSPELCIVFGRTKQRVDELTEGLKKRGYSAEGIHGDLMQSKRDKVLRQFREDIISILVATDVAARGLDISGVTHIYNFDIPQDPESYVHRVGRTGRAGRTGSAVSFIVPREMEYLHSIERLTRRKILRLTMPTISEVLEGQQRAAIDRLMSTVEEGSFEEYGRQAEELLTEYDSVTLLSAALKLLTKEPNTTPVRLTEVAPLRSKNAPRHRPQFPKRGMAEQNRKPGHWRR
jgi:ATP-dependent RNA helicase DeaD